MWQTAADQYAALHREFPGVAEYVRELAAIKNCLAQIDEANRDGTGMLHKLDEVLALIAELQAKGDKAKRLDTILHSARLGRCAALDLLNRHADAVKAWDDVIAGDPERRNLWRSYQAVQLVKSGQVDAGLAVVREVTSAAAAEAELYYNGACAAAQAVLADPAHAEAHTATAIGLLGRARDAGYFRKKLAYDTFVNDRDLAPLDGNAEFRAYRESVRPPTPPRP